VSRPAGRGSSADRHLVLPHLTPFAGEQFESRHDYDLIGIDNLRGAIISRAQLSDLAPLLAEQLGLDVRSD
jgi:hypothetical protein